MGEMDTDPAWLTEGEWEWGKPEATMETPHQDLQVIMS